MRKSRIIAAALFWGLTTLLFLDFTGTLHQWFGWLPRLQIVPAILAVNALGLLIMALVTIIFGRLYCSVVCPLGIMQDIISSLSARLKSRRNRFRYTPAKAWLRYGLLAILIFSMLAGTSVMISLLDPYAAYGRIASNLLSPAFRQGNNLMAWLAENVGSYAFYSTEVVFSSALAIGISVLTFGLVGFLAWRSGRTYCNTICPVGTVLGFVARFSFFRPTFNAHKCMRCGRCERTCKSSCIDSGNRIVDHSRCVTCFNCLDQCKSGAITYAPRWFTPASTIKVITPSFGGSAVTHLERVGPDPAPVSHKAGLTRRGLLSMLAFMALTSAAKVTRAQQLHVDGGLADLVDKKRPTRQTPLVPPGAKSLINLNRHCTACLLCVSACPQNILSPSVRLSTLMQPEMSYERGYCRPECTECSQVCPAGAIKKVSVAEKSAISIGRAVWLKDNCLPNKGETACTSCEHHCPTGAITLVARDRNDGNSPKIPVIDNELCIGCGACEYYCPARPFSAIYVEGHVRHHQV